MINHARKWAGCASALKWAGCASALKWAGCASALGCSCYLKRYMFASWDAK